jgi:hypothetical protein
MADGYRDFIAGTVGGFSGKMLDYPLDTVKVLLQTQSSLSSTPSINSTKRTPLYRGAIHCLTHTINTNGFLSLYKGLSAPLLSSMVENAVLFLSYAEVKRQFGEEPGLKELTLWELSCAGAVAGGITSWFINPFEVIKVQMQVMNSTSNNEVRKYNGLLDCVIQTIKNEGIAKGLYRGQTSLLLREVPGNFCWYGVYEAVCLSQVPTGGTKRDLSMSSHLIGGACAGVAYWSAFYPADTVGSQMRANPAYANRSFIDVFVEIFRMDGWKGLYRGWSITAVRAAPAHALIFAMYEQTMNIFRRFDPQMEDSIDKRSGSISHSS